MAADCISELLHPNQCGRSLRSSGRNLLHTGAKYMSNTHTQCLTQLEVVSHSLFPIGCLALTEDPVQAFCELQKSLENKNSSFSWFKRVCIENTFIINVYKFLTSAESQVTMVTRGQGTFWVQSDLNTHAHNSNLTKPAYFCNSHTAEKLFCYWGELGMGLWGEMKLRSDGSFGSGLFQLDLIIGHLAGASLSLWLLLVSWLR